MRALDLSGPTSIRPPWPLLSESLEQDLLSADYRGANTFKIETSPTGMRVLHTASGETEFTVCSAADRVD